MKIDKLLLGGVPLSSASALLISESLSSLTSNFSSITHVDISNTGVTTEGFHALCEAIAKLPDLRVLIANDNALPKEGSTNKLEPC